jgi:hypothetical protein
VCVRARARTINLRISPLHILMHSCRCSKYERAYSESSREPYSHIYLSHLCDLNVRVLKAIIGFWRGSHNLRSCPRAHTQSARAQVKPVSLLIFEVSKTENRGIGKRHSSERAPGGLNHESATCVQRFDDSLIPAIHTTYRISLRSSSSREPRYPLLGVVIISFGFCILMV